MSSVCVPCATIRPPSSSATRSASASVDGRWTTRSPVTPSSTRDRDSSITASVCNRPTRAGHRGPARAVLPARPWPGPCWEDRPCWSSMTRSRRSIAHRGCDRGIPVACARGRHGTPGRPPAVDAGACRPRRAARRRSDRCAGDAHRAHEVERSLPRAALAGIREGTRGGARLSAAAPAGLVQGAPPSDRWRGVASEEIDEFSASVAGLLRRRSRRLLAELARPYRGQIALARLLIVIRSPAYLSLPYLVRLRIDKGIRPGGSRNPTTPHVIVSVLLLALVVNALANYAFLRLSGRIGADVLFDLR